jgi:crotonobetainyl-CoA hydratase
MSEASHPPVVLYERHENTAVIVLNRPHVLNAVNTELANAIGARLEEAAADPGIHAIVIAGAGRAFCSGADLREVAADRSVSSTENPSWGFAGIANHWIDKPTIAAVHGYSMGGGTEIALACDLIVASEDAKFGFPEVKRGLLAVGGGLVRLQHQVPIRLAMQLALTGDPIDAATAAKWGLINEVVPVGEALAKSLDLACRITANAPLSVRATKRLIHQNSAAGSDWNPMWTGQDAWKATDAAMKVLYASADAREGARAFAEKRTPVWFGR